MPILLIAAASLVTGIALTSPWVVTVAIIAVTAIGTVRAAVKAHDYGHSSDIAEAREPGAVLFSLFVYSLVIGLPYLVGIGVRSIIN
jgi:hypothetical protein